MGLVGEALEKARRQVERLWEETEGYRQEAEKRREEEWRNWVEMGMREEKMISEGAVTAETISEELSVCWGEWTEACLKWFEIYEEGNGG